MDNEYLIDYRYLENSEPENLEPNKFRSVDELLKDPENIIERLNKGFEEHLTRSIKNPIILKEFLKEDGWDVEN